MRSLHISRYLIELEDRLESLQQELKKVREWVLALEEENQQLRRELQRHVSSAGGEARGEDASSGYANLQRLYDENFHVCPHSFGQRRWGGCLFCVALLERARGRPL